MVFGREYIANFEVELPFAVQSVLCNSINATAVLTT